jgi:hypothetical protein
MNGEETRIWKEWVVVCLKVLSQRLHVGHKMICDNSRYPAQIRTDDPLSSVNYCYNKIFVSRNSAVGTATSYGLDDQEVRVRVPVGSRIFSSPRHPDGLWGPPNLLSNGYRGLFRRGLKRPGCEADHSPPTSAEVKKVWIYTPTPHIRLHGVVLN